MLDGLGPNFNALTWLFVAENDDGKAPIAGFLLLCGVTSPFLV